ncbi:MAG: Tex family protein [Eubacteriales bacterium]|nr:Tex family protein [Eubacteriales bacterium]
MELIKQLAGELALPAKKIEAAVKLMDEGNTVPFIARYRKEQTGGLNDEALRKLAERLRYLRTLEEKKETVRNTIEAAGQLTPDLAARIDAVLTQVELDDLYRPFRPKRRTRATMAKERGLEPLAEQIWTSTLDGEAMVVAAAYISETVPTAEDALAGASDILAERVADGAAVRAYVRRRTMLNGRLTASAKDMSASSVYEGYYNFERAVGEMAGHQVLAVNRGEKEGFLTVKIVVDEAPLIHYITRKLAAPNPDERSAPLIAAAVEDAYKRLIFPAVEREIRNALTERAEDGAIAVFRENLKQLLMQPPMAGKTVLGWDPAFRTGCKLAVCDATGRVMDTTVIFPTAPQRKVAQAERLLSDWHQRYGFDVISLGNGTASRESEQVIADWLRNSGIRSHYAVVSEAGASVYSAGEVAAAEFPNFDVGQRSAASIARRLQDPLAELVKIDPRAIGVGQYQHDMNQKKLGEALDGVVEDCVNKVGVDLNTASPSLLARIAGVSRTVAENIVAYRDENGRFEHRRKLLKVAKLGPKMFQQCAGFLRIPGGSEPLDNTAVHPEHYEATYRLLTAAGYTKADLAAGRVRGLKQHKEQLAREAEATGIDRMTLADIMEELEKPGRDPRTNMPEPILRGDILTMEDLKEGMVLQGTVRNIVDFGAFVDIGVHEDGLVHISALADRFVKHPLDVVKVGDVVKVAVLSVDAKRKRIALSMKGKDIG